ncbi:MAG: ANTAR domain-containing protein [Planctomycetes bacterium]|nr:ANTAR domain-containing protein [Planctomycetota bacterium]MCK5579557.1 ANTAR domain-containing protein [Planctomycetota bacterium]
MKLREEVELLKKTIQIINDTLELPVLLKKIAGLIMQFVPGHSCLIYLLDSSKHQLVLRGSHNPHPKLLGHIKLKIGEGITGWVAQKKEPVAIAQNASDDPRFKFFHKLPEDRYEAFLSIPILKNNELVGVINMQHKNLHRYKKRDISLVVTIANLVVGVIEKTGLAEELLSARETIQSRKLIERAKGILMYKHKMSEEKAFKTIQSQSRNSRKTMKEIAESIILVENIQKK